MGYDFSDCIIVRDQEKEQKLLDQRGVSFTQIKMKLLDGNILGIIENPSRNHENQKLIIVDIDNYPYVVPSIIVKGYIVLKTIYPCRHYKKYL